VPVGPDGPPARTPAGPGGAPVCLSILAALLAGAACESPAPAPAPPADPGVIAPCGVDDATVPDFTLVDANPRSPTHGEALALRDFEGRVVVLHWMWAT